MKNICFFSGDITRSGGTERVGSVVANELAKTNSDTTATINIEYTGARVEEDKEESIAAEDIDAETVAATMEVVADILEEEVAE